jgi:hypothetical protein
MASGIKRLVLGTAQYTWNQSATATTIRATGTFPAAASRAGCSSRRKTDTSRTYVLCFEHPDVPSGDAPEGFSLRERYAPGDNRSVSCRDAAGVHVVH